MEKLYNPTIIEKKAQEYWDKNQSFKAIEDENKEKFYSLSMFPYPSGKLHMGHVRNYTLGDIISRYQRMKGKNVMQPMGWDAFGLPAEGAAIKNKMPPAKWTYENIAYMKSQLKSLGFAYDWDREITTCDPDYYKWEQWFFTRLYEKGLVYKKNSEVNWDPVDQTVLANEQVIDGRGWRSGALVEKREIPQWFIRITDYAEELLSSLDDPNLEWPEKVITMQKNWIGKSTGVEVDFSIKDTDKSISVFTTRPDTLYGVSFIAIAHNHPLAKQQAEKDPVIKDFCKKISKNSTAESDIETMDKVGIPTNLFVNHPLTNKQIPILIANFVLMSYGTGAIMAVPAHDQRDFEFAKKYNLSITPVIEHPNDFLWEKAYLEKGKLVNSGIHTGLSFDEAFEQITNTLVKKGIGNKKTNYRLRDWGVSRQRYWGAPIPFYNNSTSNIPVPLKDLPVILPEDVAFNETGSPIKSMPEFIYTTDTATGEKLERETDTFDTFMESSWYYARYTCPDNNDKMLDERANYWLPVDQYIGGIEHAILHLLYARFFHKLLRDEGLVNSDEPFKKLLTQGMVVAPTYYREQKDGSKIYFNPDSLDIKRDSKGKSIKAIHKDDKGDVTIGKIEKMSKSKNNGTDPQSLIDLYGADTVRLFIAFAAPPEQSLEWSESGVEGAYKYLRKVWSYITKFKTEIIANDQPSIYTNAKIKNIRKNIHQSLEQANQDIERQQLNTVVSACMKIYNSLSDIDTTDKESNMLRYEGISILLRILSPITPHITHHIWQELGLAGDIISASWPEPDPEAMITDQIDIVIQVNGKLRAKLQASPSTDKDKLITQALAHPNVIKFIDKKEIIKTIAVPNKLINIVVKN